MFLDDDAFASGQILSKIWLAETLEQVVKYQNITDPLKILILGGWYGQLHLIFRLRKNLKIDRTTNIDIDPAVKEISEKINETWIWQNKKFETVIADANDFEYSKDDYNLIINTSVEHLKGRSWFENIPLGSLVVLQSNDMPHDDHVGNHKSLNEFSEEFEMSEKYYDGVKSFQYPNKFFKRFMIIGIK